MKKIISLILVVFLLFNFAVFAFAEGATMSVYSSNVIPSGTMRMIAHTGYSAVAPANTIPAYVAAGESDFWGAECDIQRTKDGVWVLMHDDTVDRTTDGTGKVTELTYAEILEFNVDAGNNIEKYPGLKVPRFEDYLDVCREYGLHPVIEVKPNADPAYMGEITAILSSREEKDMFYVICFNRELCVRLKELMPSLRVYYLIGFENVSQEDIDFAVDNHLDGMDIHVFLPDDYVNAVTASGLDVFVWTIDDLGNAERFYNLGVNAITTNSLTQEKPEGNFLQRIIWALRDSLYKLRLFFSSLFGGKVC